VDQQTRGLLNELQGAVRQALCGSNRFLQIIDLLERSGHTLLLSVDAAIDGIDERDFLHAQHVGNGVLSELSLSCDDRRFLRAMKIDVEAEG
jgi:hypothetical protein